MRASCCRSFCRDSTVRLAASWQVCVVLWSEYEVNFAQAPAWTLRGCVGLSECARVMGVGLWRECDRVGVLSCRVSEELRLEASVSGSEGCPRHTMQPAL